MHKKILHLLLLTLLVNIHSTSINFFEKEINKIKDSLSSRSQLEQILMLENYIKNSPETAELYKMKINLEMSVKDHSGVIKTADSALKSGIKDKDILYSLTIAYIYAGNFSEAGETVKKILQLNPEDQTGLYFMKLLPQNIEVKTSYSFTYPDIEELLSEYNRNPDNNIFPFLYLYQGKSVIVKNERENDYTLTALLRLNSDENYDELSEYELLFDSKSFSPLHKEAGIISSTGAKRILSAENIAVNNDYQSDNSLKGSIKFNFGSNKTGDILYYSIYFKSNIPQPISKMSDTFYTGSQMRVLRKEYSVIYPEDLNVYIYTDKIHVSPSTENDNGFITKKFSFINPPMYFLSDESISIFDLSPSISVTSIKDWSEAGDWFFKKFQSFSRNITPYKINTDSKDSKISVLRKSYEYLQKNTADSSSDSADSSKIPSDFYDINGLYQTLEFIETAKAFGITAFPALLSSYGNEQPSNNNINPNIFNTAVVFIPKQSGIENDLFADPTSVFGDFGNLNYLYQGLNSLIVKPDTASEIKAIPVVEGIKNRMSEDYILNIDIIGQADIKLKQKITGSFSEYFRKQISGYSEEEKKDFFFTMQKDSFSDLKKSDFSIDGLNNHSGDITVSINTKSSKVTDIHFDAKQVMNFSLGEVKEWINLPESTGYPYRKNFIYSYHKRMECIFPEGYTLSADSLSNMERNNKYLNFKFYADKVGENHFILEYELTLNSLIIEAGDLPLINAQIDQIASSLDFKVTLIPPEDYDYIKFFDLLLENYQQDAIYRNYITRLLTDTNAEKAMELIEKGLELFPDEVYYNILKSLVNFDLGNYDDAEKMLFEALEKTDEKLFIYGYIIDLYKKTGKSSDLYELLNKLIADFPGNEQIISELINYHKNNDNIQAIVELLENNSQIYSEKAGFYSDLGYYYSLLKNNEKAEYYLKKALDNEPSNKYALNNLAWLYCETGKNIAEATEMAIKAVSMDPDNYNFLDTLAECYYLLNEFEKAVYYIERALTNNPDSGYLLEQKSKFQSAYEREENND